MKLSNIIRVNAVLPGLLLSECIPVLELCQYVGGLKYGNEMIEAQKELAPLKSATDMGDCADAFVMLARNRTPSMIFSANNAKRVSPVPPWLSMQDYRSCHETADQRMMQ